MELTRKEKNALRMLRYKGGKIRGGKPEIYDALVAKGLAEKCIGSKGYAITKAGLELEKPSTSGQ